MNPARFIKHTKPGGQRESQRHRWLAARGVPLPELIEVIDHGDHEQLVLEHLPSIGFGDDPDEVLALLVALNSIDAAPDEIFTLPPGRPQTEFEHLLADVIEPAHLEGYRRCLALQAGFATALTHGEFSHTQVGRTQAGQLVMFDLETCAPRARFSDLANVVTALSRQSGRAELDLFAQYLTLGGPGTGEPVHAAWTELLTTRVVVITESLPWAVGEPAIDHEVLFATVAADLTELGWS